MSPGPRRQLTISGKNINHNERYKMADQRFSQTGAGSNSSSDRECGEQPDAIRSLTPLDLSLAPFKLEDNGHDSVFDEDTERELGPLAWPTVNEDELDDVPGMPTRSQWKSIVHDYLAGLHPTKRQKSLISHDFYKMIFRTLKAPDATRLGTPQFRFWARKMFQLVEAPNNILVVTNGGRPVAIKEHIYDILCMCHSQCNHGGRDKTCKVLRDYYTWVPKELISNFVKACPTCAPRKIMHAKSKDHKAVPASFIMSDEPAPNPPPRITVERLKDFGQLPSPPESSSQLTLPPLIKSSFPLVPQDEDGGDGLVSPGCSFVKFRRTKPLPPWTPNAQVTLPPLNLGPEERGASIGNDAPDGNKRSSLPPLMPYLSGRYTHGVALEHPKNAGHSTLDVTAQIDPVLLEAVNHVTGNICACRNPQCSGCQDMAHERYENALHLQLRPATPPVSSHQNTHHLTIDTSVCRPAKTGTSVQEIVWEFPSVAGAYGAVGESSALLSASTTSIGLPTPSTSGHVSPAGSGYVPNFHYYAQQSGSFPTYVGITEEGRYQIQSDAGIDRKTMSELEHDATPPLLSPRPVKMENSNPVLELNAAISSLNTEAIDCSLT